MEDQAKEAEISGVIRHVFSFTHWALREELNMEVAQMGRALLLVGFDAQLA